MEQHKWAEEGAELKGRLTAHEAQLDLMQVNMRETDQARTNLAQDLARLRVELEKVSTALCQHVNAFRNLHCKAPSKQQNWTVAETGMPLPACIHSDACRTHITGLHCMQLLFA